MPILILFNVEFFQGPTGVPGFSGLDGMPVSMLPMSAFHIRL